MVITLTSQMKGQSFREINMPKVTKQIAEPGFELRFRKPSPVGATAFQKTRSLHTVLLGSGSHCCPSPCLTEEGSPACPIRSLVEAPNSVLWASHLTSSHPCEELKGSKDGHIPGAGGI